MVRLLTACLVLALSPMTAYARELTLDSIAAMRAACAEAATPGRRKLYVVHVPRGGFRFLPYDAESGFLALDTRRNLRAFDGALEVYPSGRESIGFHAAAERAALLAAMSERASLRVGFFLGFDGARGSQCVMRAAVSTSTARIDVAFVELVDEGGATIAREETERLRAFADDDTAIPGEGPRADVGRPDVVRGGTPATNLARAITQSREAFARAATQCFTQALPRGAAREATVIVRLVVDPATGAVSQATVEMSTLGDDQGATCVAEQFRGVPRAPGQPGSALVVLVPVRLLAD